MRLISGLRSAELTSLRPFPKPSSVWSRSGLSYERNVVKALRGSGLSVLHNPAFTFKDRLGVGYCVLDALVADYRGRTLIFECKLTYKAEAVVKLNRLYIPIVKSALGLSSVTAIVVAKNLTPDSPAPFFTLESVLCSTPQQQNLIQWLGRGKTFPLT